MIRLILIFDSFEKDDNLRLVHEYSQRFHREFVEAQQTMNKQISKTLFWLNEQHFYLNQFEKNSTEPRFRIHFISDHVCST